MPIDKLVADFRSDTVTRISPAMKQVMFSNENYGDDVYDEDIIVKELESRVATLCNKENALFCVSGTMSNQLGLRAQLGALQSLICDSRAHIYEYEAGGVSYHSQAQVRPIVAEEDQITITAKQVEENIVTKDVHCAVSAGVALENTIWGKVLDINEIKKIKIVCDANDLFLHLDGARLPNACVKAGLSLAEFTEPFDSISICLSKSLGCPIGSVIVGSNEMIQRAKHFRKLFGGGWRQAGILASAGLFAFDHHWDRLAEDHANAEYLTKEFIELGFQLEIPTETNQIWLNSKPLNVTFDEISAACKKEGIRIPNGKHSARIVTHIQTPKQHCSKLIEIFKQVLQSK